MKAIGLITEYNPFHNGHKYHIEEAKRITGADYTVVVMSGDFVQRGCPAIIDKYSRTEMAIKNGADLVLELPVCYAAGSAEYFAHGAVSLLDKLGIIDTLCFGSECGDINILKKAAGFLAEVPAAFDEQLQAFLRDGLTYPAARLKALANYLKDNSYCDADKLTKVLTEPNNILAVEYMKAISHLHSSMSPVTIKRISAHYHDLSLPLSFDTNAGTALSDYTLLDLPDQNLPVISSATAIRKAIHDFGSSLCGLARIKESVPDAVYHIMAANYSHTFPITEDDFSLIVKYRLLSEDSTSLSGYMDISSDLADRLKKYADDFGSIGELIQKVKTKNMTMTRISRALAHLLLNIRSEAVEEYNLNGYTAYARILGIKKESSQLLREIEKVGRIALITKVSKASEQLGSLGMRMLSEDIFAAHLYNQVVFQKYGTALPNEYKRGICII